LEKVGAGRRCHLSALSPERVQAFIDSAAPLPRRTASGAADVAKIIRAELRTTPVSVKLTQTLEVFA
jgi:hypothetical protein